MIIVEQLSAVAGLLLEAAKAEGEHSFSDFHAVFDPDSKNNDRYDTLEASSIALASSGAIYSAVLAKKEDGCPGSGFYDIFNNVHRAEFYSIAGHNDPQQLTVEDRKRIAIIERARVYEHADKHFRVP